jgi:hypothetical protein
MYKNKLQITFLKQNKSEFVFQKVVSKNLIWAFAK